MIYQDPKDWDEIVLSPSCLARTCKDVHHIVVMIQCSLTTLGLVHCLNYDLLEAFKRRELQNITQL